MKKQKCGGFSYYVTEEQIREYSKLDVAQKLAWLEAANDFTFKTLPKKNWAIWEKFRSGEI